MKMNDIEICVTRDPKKTDNFLYVVYISLMTFMTFCFIVIRAARFACIYASKKIFQQPSEHNRANTQSNSQTALHQTSGGEKPLIFSNIRNKARSSTEDQNNDPNNDPNSDLTATLVRKRKLSLP